MEGRRRVALIVLIAVVVIAGVVALGVGVGGWRLHKSDKASPAATSAASQTTGASGRTTTPAGDDTVVTLPPGVPTDTPRTLPNGVYCGYFCPRPGETLPTGPAVVPGRVSTLEGNSGTTRFKVPVTLSESSKETIRVDYRTLFVQNPKPSLPPQADPKSDYQATLGTVTFKPGHRRAFVVVTVNGDTTAEANEFFLVSFINPVHARLGGLIGLGGGIITDDDT